MLPLVLLACTPSWTVQAPSSEQTGAREFLETLDGALAGLPYGRFSFRVERVVAPAPDGLAERLAAHRLASWLTAYHGVTGEQEVADETRETIDFQVEEFVRISLEQPPAILQWPPRFTLDVNAGFAECRGPLLVEGEAGSEASGSKIVAFLPDEVVTVVSTAVTRDGAQSRGRQAFRERASSDDLERRDNTGFVALARTFPRSLLNAMAGRPEHWTFRREGEVVVAQYEVATPTKAFPPIGLYGGVEFGTLEARLDLAHGFLSSVVVTDNLGLVTERYEYGDVVADEHGALPLRVRHETWYPMDGRPERKSQTYMGEASPPPSGRTPLAALLSPGTHVEDLRVTPAVSYTQGLLPLEDSVVFARSASAAGTIGHSELEVLPDAAAVQRDHGTARTAAPPGAPRLQPTRLTPPVEAEPGPDWTRGAIALVGVLALAIGARSLAVLRARGAGVRTARALSATLHLGLAAMALAHVLRSDAPVRAAEELGLMTIGDTDLDLGLVQAGEQRAFEFELYNPTAEPVVLQYVTTTCGCTLVQPDRSLLDPGESMKLFGDIDTAYDGNRFAEVFVEIKGFEEPLRVGSVRFEVANHWRPTVKDPVLVVGGSNPPLHLEHRDATPPDSVTADCDVPGVRLAPRLIDGHLWLDVTLDPDLVPCGEYDAEISIASPGDDAPFTYLVTIRHEAERYATIPRSIVPGEGFLRSGQAASLSFAVVRDGRPVAVRTVRTADSDYAAVDVRCEGNLARLTVTPLAAPESSDRVCLDVELEDAVLRVVAYLPYASSVETKAAKRRDYKTVSVEGR